jgi:methanogenic corrinoid protein MtbC1
VNVDARIEQLFQAITTGDRERALGVVSQVRQDGLTAEETALQVLWPALESVRQLSSAEQMTTIARRYALRLLRTIADRLQAEYEHRARTGQRILAFAGVGDEDDLVGQILADLAEAAGGDVHYGGSGIAADEIIAAVGERRPHALMLVSSSADDRAGLIELVDRIREIAAAPELRVVVGGGIKRPRALASAIDHWGGDGAEIVAAALAPAARPKRRVA